MYAYIFPGQGSQFVGMGKKLYDTDPTAKKLFETANQILGFSITDIMFEGTEEVLQKTDIAQPAIFIHSTILAAITPGFKPSMVAGHSLGEFSALVASQVLNFEDGLKLVKARAIAMQKACAKNPGTMAAILGLPDDLVTEICKNIHEVIVPANYNSPGQLVISGTQNGVALACEALQAAGTKKIVSLRVGGAFHSPLMEPAKEELAVAIDQVSFKKGICPIYQNVSASPTTDPEKIKQQLIQQLTSPILWAQTIQRMVQDGASEFIECGPGKVLQGLVKRIEQNAQVSGIA